MSTNDRAAPICNRCGLSCALGPHGFAGGLTRHTVTGGFDSTPGNGFGALDDLDGYTFSLCEFCCDWLFQTFVVPVEVGEMSIEGNRLVSTDGERRWRPAAQRVEEDEWRRMKDEFRAEHDRRARAREGN